MQTAILISLIAVLFAYLASFKIFKYGLEIAMSIITVFVAIRYEWGTDMPGYCINFHEFANYGLSSYDFRAIAQIRGARTLEIGWAFLNVICSPIGFFGMIILLAIIDNLIIYNFIKRNVEKKYYWLAVFIYTFNPYMMVLGCSMIRQWLAMCIVLYASRFISSGKLKYYVLFIILAASFHTSALLFLILYLVRFANKIDFDNSEIIILGAMSLVWIIIGRAFSMSSVVALMSTEAFEGYDEYLQQGKSGGGLGFGSLFQIFLYLFCIVQTRSIPQEKRFLCKVLFMYIILFPFTDVVNLASRLNLYIDAFAIVAIPLAIKASTNKVLNYGLVGLCFFWYIFQYQLFFKAPSFYWAFNTYHTIFETTWQ